MATNITNQQIDNAVPDKGSSTPHPEQPNRKLANGILKEIVAETNTLGTAATKNVGTAAGNVMEVGAFGIGNDGAAARTRPENIRDVTHSGMYQLGGGAGEDYPLVGVGSTLLQLNWERDTEVKTQIVHGLNNKVFVGAYGVTGWLPYRELIHTGNILTTTGQSTEYPMTQKATTDAINGISDERDKTDVNEIDLGLEVIENINTFSFKLNNRDWYRQEAAKELIEVEDEDGKVTIQEKINSDVLNAPLSDFEENDGSLKRDDVYTGFVAQDLKETLEALGLGHLGIVKNYAEEYEGGEDRFYIEHLSLLPFLVNSVKQLSARVKELEDAAE